MISAQEALDRLREGNARFASRTTNRKVDWPGYLTRPVVEQEPFAIILGCSDSRVPVEIVFDQDLGDLFVIRVAGNVVASSQIGSTEFAAERFGTRLAVVLGHTHCGAVRATLEANRGSPEFKSPHLRTIVDYIRPSVRGLDLPGIGHDEETLVRQGVRANVCASVDRLRTGSEALARLIRQEQLLVVGAEYSLETGIVDFFERPEDE